MRIKPFRAVRPSPGLEAEIASPPYDVVDVVQARAIASDHPRSFLHVTRADIDLPEGTDPRDPSVYTAAAEAYRRFTRNGWLCPDDTPGLYAYRLAGGGHEQTGLVAVAHAREYEEGRIKRHEFTRPVPEEDRTRHIDALNAQTGPVLLAFRDDERIAQHLEHAAAAQPLFDIEASDGIRHTGWRIPDADALAADFAAVPAAYIADGHHRIAGAARVARERRDGRSDGTGGEEYEWILAVLFPASRLRILPYHRQVLDLNGMTPADFLRHLEHPFTIDPLADAPEPAAGRIDLYMDGRWNRLAPRTVPPADDPVAILDVSLLQDRILEDILGIHDPRRDERLRCIGGCTPCDLARDVDRGLAAAAFSLSPVRIEQIMAVSDAGRTMPPKSTWFEPKLRSGLFVHELTAPA